MSSIAHVYVPETDAPAAVRVPAPLPQDVPHLFVIPAHNEQENLPRLFSDLEARPALLPNGSRVIVVDDGSVDDTASIVGAYAGPLPVELVSLGRNQGPGAAFRAGFA